MLTFSVVILIAVRVLGAILKACLVSQIAMELYLTELVLKGGTQLWLLK